MAFRPATLLKRDSDTGFFSVRFAKFLRTPLFSRNATSGGCLLYDSETYDMAKLYLCLDSNFFSVL